MHVCVLVSVRVFTGVSLLVLLLQTRQQLLQSSVNAATLRDIETALFILVLADEAPQVRTEKYLSTAFGWSVSS